MNLQSNSMLAKSAIREQTRIPTFHAHDMTAALDILIFLLAAAARDCSSFGFSSRSYVPKSTSTRLLLNLNPFASRQSLREQCEERYPSSIWADNVTEGYEAAATVFGALLNASCSGDGAPRQIWFPKMKETQMLSGLAESLNDNTERLGGWSASLERWPMTPTTGIFLTLVDGIDLLRSKDLLDAMDQTEAVEATKHWVNNTLGRLGLCPHVASTTRAAIGLDSVGVSSGPVVVRHTMSAPLRSDDDNALTDAMILGASFWNAVLDLARCPETDVATFLLIAPPAYDENFADFVATCDNLLERSCKAVRADSIIGKAWFHPRYNSSVVGQDSILPGHALPAEMVTEFVHEYFGDVDGHGLAAVSRANDAVRHTPHATVNLLRRSQLQASKEAEAASLSSVSTNEGKQRRKKGPNSIYAQNVIRLLSLEDDS
jgi:hypothetical protein